MTSFAAREDRNPKALDASAGPARHAALEMRRRVIEANSGKRALEIIDAGQAIDLMVTDQASPRLSKPYQQAQLQAEIEKLLDICLGARGSAAARRLQRGSAAANSSPQPSNAY
jgi:CheY-like chemotaxis protein